MQHLTRILLFIVLLICIPAMTMWFSATSAHEGSVNVDAVVEAPFITQHSGKDAVLLFFGYVGCVEVCTPLLEEVSAIYRDSRLDGVRDTFDVLFVNLLTTVSPEQPDQFAKHFDNAFTGIYLDDAALRSIERDFRLVFSPSLLNEEELNHSDFLYLLRRTEQGLWHLEKLYFIHPINRKRLIADLRPLKES